MRCVDWYQTMLIKNNLFQNQQKNKFIIFWLMRPQTSTGPKNVRIGRLKSANSMVNIEKSINQAPILLKATSKLDIQDYKNTAAIFKIHKNVKNDLYNGCPYLKNFYSKMHVQKSFITERNRSVAKFQGQFMGFNTSKNIAALYTLNNFIAEFRMNQEAPVIIEIEKDNKADLQITYGELGKKFIQYCKMIKSVYEILMKLLEKIHTRSKNYNDIDNIFREMEEHLEKNSANINFLLLLLKKHAEILMEFRMYKMAIVILKILKNKSEDYQIYLYKTKSYKLLARCFQILKKYDVSNVYGWKLLKFSWYLKIYKYEMEAYDILGMNAFYKGNLVKAKYYHNKMTKGESELIEDSDTKNVGVNSINNRIQRKEYRRKLSENELGNIKKIKTAFLEKNEVDFYVSSSEEEEEPHFKELDEYEDLQKLKVLYSIPKYRPQSAANHLGLIKSYVSAEVRKKFHVGKILKDEFFQDPIEKRYLSHLSNNRVVENFQAYDNNKAGFLTAGGQTVNNQIIVPEGKPMINVKKYIKKVESSMKFIYYEFVSLLACENFNYKLFIDNIKIQLLFIH